MKGAAANANPEPLSAKRRQILSAARQVFGELGFERASVDLIASRAGVSKATVYNHFEDKKALFVASVVEECDEMCEGLQRCLGRATGDLEVSLQRVGEQLMAVYLSPVVTDLYRHVIAEASRFPDIGRMVFERGTMQLTDAVAAYLARWSERGLLQIEDARSAASQFIALCQGELAARSRFGLLEYPVDDQVRDSVKRAVRTFLRAVRP